jgi:hypothetical protein
MIIIFIIIIIIIILSSFEITMIGLHTQFCESWHNVIFLFWEKKKKLSSGSIVSRFACKKKKLLSDKFKLLSLCCRGQKRN